MIKKIKKTIFFKAGFPLLIFLIFFTLLIIFNYQKAQKALKDNSSPEIKIFLTTFPQDIKAKNTQTFNWQIDTPNTYTTSQTAVYYGSQSNSGQLNPQDSPQDQKYTHYTTDYLHGAFFLPDTFSSSAEFPLPGQIYYRAYANINGQHYWTDEYHFTITSLPTTSSETTSNEAVK